MVPPSLEFLDSGEDGVVVSGAENLFTIFKSK